MKDAGLADFQNRNCTDCYFADKKMVGSGEACCQFPRQLDIKLGLCSCWRADLETLEKLEKTRAIMDKALRQRK